MHCWRARGAAAQQGQQGLVVVLQMPGGRPASAGAHPTVTVPSVGALGATSPATVAVAALTDTGAKAAARAGLRGASGGLGASSETIARHGVIVRCCCRWRALRCLRGGSRWRRWWCGGRSLQGGLRRCGGRAQVHGSHAAAAAAAAVAAAAVIIAAVVAAAPAAASVS